MFERARRRSSPTLTATFRTALISSSLPLRPTGLQWRWRVWCVSMPHAITEDGVRLYYEEAGTGRPVIFVHEFAGDYRSWEPQLRRFARLYRCIAFNARGYPPSDVPESPQSYS